MGSPLSGILADLYLNHLENTKILKDNYFANKIIHYSRYVDDTFNIFNGNARQIELFKNYLNKIHNKLKFTMEIENNKSINFLDLTVLHNGNNLKYKIFRKHTNTDTVIHYDSHHPVTQKWQYLTVLSTYF